MISATRTPDKYGVSKGMVDPHLRLAAGILANAAQQAKNEADIAAVAWLLDGDCIDIYCPLLELDSEAVRRFVETVDLAGVS